MKYCYSYYTFLIYFFTVLYLQHHFVKAIRFTKVHIPQTGINGSSLKLICKYEFDNDNEKLYSIKYYKDGSEFFRFLPAARPKHNVFKLPGIDVDIRETNESQVILRNLNQMTTGLFKIEIIADLSFQTLFEEGNISIIVPPSPIEPIFSNTSTKVLIGEVFLRNCTSFSSLPPANLSLFVNEVKVKNSNLIRYQNVQESGSGAESESHNSNINRTILQTAILGVKFRVDHSHFVRGYLKLKCVSTIYNMQWVKEIVITHKNSPNFLANVRQRFSKGSKITNGNGNFLISFCLIFILSFKLYI